MTTDTVKFKLTLQQFNKLKANLKATPANDGYFPYRQLRDMKVPTGKDVLVEFSPEQFQGIKNALARLDTGVAESSLDLVFDIGEPQIFAINTRRQADVEAQLKNSAANQTGLPDLQEVKVTDIKKAKKKVSKSKRKAG